MKHTSLPWSGPLNFYVLPLPFLSFLALLPPHELLSRSQLFQAYPIFALAVPTFSPHPAPLLTWFAPSLSQFRLLQQNNTDWVPCKQQKLIAHSSGGWKSLIVVSAWLGEDLLRGHGLLYAHMVEGARDLCGVSFIRPLILFMSALPLWHNHFPKATPVNAISFRG